MKFITENFEVIVILLFMVMIFMSALILSFNKYFAMYFSNKKFHIISSFDLNALEGTKDFTIQIFNKNINDIRVTGFGYVYKGQNIDFYQNFIKERDLPKDHKIVISSRDHLSTKININVLKAIVSDINKGSTYVETIKTYVTDGLGLTTSANAKQVRTQVLKMLIADQQEREKVAKEQRQKQRQEILAFQKKQARERQLKRKEVYARWMLKIKSKFRKKNPS